MKQCVEVCFVSGFFFFLTGLLSTAGHDVELLDVGMFVFLWKLVIYLKHCTSNCQKESLKKLDGFKMVEVQLVV